MIIVPGWDLETVWINLYLNQELARQLVLTNLSSNQTFPGLKTFTKLILSCESSASPKNKL